MRLTVLCDNNTYIDRYCIAEPAVSYLIEDGARTVLFDAGYSEVFLENARRMGIDLARVTDIVLSHGHNDHTGGLPAFFRSFSQPVRLYAHPDAFLPKRAEGLDVGAPLSEDGLPAQVERHIGKAPRRISKNVLLLGQIPRVHAEEGCRTVGQTQRGGVWEPDPVLDDTALLLFPPEGAFLVTGCTHAGVMNLIDHAEAQADGRRITGLLGGLHLMEADAYAARCIGYLIQKGVCELYPAHCVSLPVKAALCRVCTVHEVGVSLQIAWD